MAYQLADTSERPACVELYAEAAAEAVVDLNEGPRVRVVDLLLHRHGTTGFRWLPRGYVPQGRFRALQTDPGARSASLATYGAIFCWALSPSRSRRPLLSTRHHSFAEMAREASSTAASSVTTYARHLSKIHPLEKELGAG